MKKKIKKIVIKDYNEEEGFYSLPVGEFRWNFKHLTDQSMNTTTRVDMINGVFNYVKQIKNTLVGCFLVYTSKRYTRLIKRRVEMESLKIPQDTAFRSALNVIPGACKS